MSRNLFTAVAAPFLSAIRRRTQRRRLLLVFGLSSLFTAPLALLAPLAVVLGLIGLCRDVSGSVVTDDDARSPTATRPTTAAVSGTREEPTGVIRTPVASADARRRPIDNALNDTRRRKEQSWQP